MKLADRIVPIAPSATLAITAKAKAMKAKGIDVIGFGAGEPDFDTPDYIKKKAIESIEKGFTKYTPTTGIPELKTAIVDKFKRENGLVYTEKQIIVSCGAKHSLYNIFQVLINKGDEVIIPAPFWLSYPEMVKLADGTPIILQTKQERQFKISAQEFEKAITKKTRALILNSPSNPTGSLYTPDELKALADVAVKHNICVISDEIYEHLIYDGMKHVSIATFNDAIKALTIVVNGVSKSYAMTGWRIGYLAAPEAVAQAIANLQDHSTSNPVSFAQIGALEALRSGTTQVLKMVESFERRRNLMMDELSSIPQIIPSRPNGAFYVFCDISKTGLTSMECTNKLLDEANVAVIPGEPFGAPHHIRLSFAISDDHIVKGIRRIKEWCAKR